MRVRCLLLVAVVVACGRVGFGPDASTTATDGALSIEGSNVAFVSSFMIVPGSLGGIAAADQRCTDAARAAGLDGEFVAFLSSSTSNAGTRLAGHRGWKRRDGLLLADTVADLADGIDYLLNIDERGDMVLGVTFVVTATDATGTLNATLGTCGDWQVVDQTSAAGGNPQYTSAEFANRGPSANCNGAARLFCFGIRSNATPEPVHFAGRIAFISESGWRPGGGLSSADAHCSMEAMAAGLTGSFRAVLPTATTSAASRFDLNGELWARVDGVRLAATPTAVMTLRLDSTLNRTARGAVNESYVWAGYYAPDDAFANGGSTCNNWTSTSVTVTGSLGDSRQGAFLHGDSVAQCDGTYPLYCLQE